MILCARNVIYVCERSHLDDDEKNKSHIMFIDIVYYTINVSAAQASS